LSFLDLVLRFQILLEPFSLSTLCASAGYFLEIPVLKIRLT